MKAKILPDPKRVSEMDYPKYIGEVGHVLDDTGTWVMMEVNGDLVFVPKEDVVKV